MGFSLFIAVPQKSFSPVFIVSATVFLMQSVSVSVEYPLTGHTIAIARNSTNDFNRLILISSSVKINSYPDT